MLDTTPLRRHHTLPAAGAHTLSLAAASIVAAAPLIRHRRAAGTEDHG